MYIFGKNTVNEALKQARKIYTIYTSNEITNLNLNKQQGVKIVKTSRKELDKLVKGNHQGIVAEVEDYKLSSVDDIINCKKSELGLILMLDGIEDPHNLGAIIRTCDCAKVDGIIYKKHNSVKLNGTVAKISCGGIENVKVAEVTNLTTTLQYLKKHGYWVCGTDVNNASDYRDLKYDTNLVLIIGSEGKGISRLVKKECDFLVNMPMDGVVTSLNASVANGILLYQINTNRYYNK